MLEIKPFWFKSAFLKLTIQNYLKVNLQRWHLYVNTDGKELKVAVDHFVAQSFDLKTNKMAHIIY